MLNFRDTLELCPRLFLRRAKQRSGCQQLLFQPFRFYSSLVILGVCLLYQHCHKTIKSPRFIGSGCLPLRFHGFFNIHIQKVSLSVRRPPEIDDSALLRVLGDFDALLEQRSIKRCGMVLSGFPRHVYSLTRWPTSGCMSSMHFLSICLPSHSSVKYLWSMQLELLLPG